MKSVKMKIITLCTSLVIGASVVFTPVATFASTADELDGQVTIFYQGQEGDCGAVSAIQAFDNSTYGKEFIANLITTNSDGSYTVNLKSGSDPIVVTQKEAVNAALTGDFDAKVIEAALQKSMNIYNGCFSSDVFTEMTGFKQKQVSGSKNKTSFMNTLALKCASGEGITACCDFNIADDSLGIIGNGEHSYSIKSVTDDTVVVVNPWDTSVDITMSRTQFENSIRYMTYIDNSAKKVRVFWS